MEDTKKQQEADEIERLKEIAEREKKAKLEKELKSMVDQITDYIKENKTDREKIMPLIGKTKELGYENPTLINTID